MVRRLTARSTIRLLAAPAWHSWLEALALGALLLLLVWLGRNSITLGEQQNGVFTALLSTMSWHAIRLHRASGSWWWRIGFEAGIGLLGALGAGWLIWLLGISILPGTDSVLEESGLTAITGAVLWAIEISVIEGESLPDRTTPLIYPSVTTTLFVSGIIAYVMMRSGAYLWQLWAGMRRRRLIWALTHSHMMLVVLGLFVFATYVTISLLSYYVSTQEQSNIVYSATLGLIPLLIIIGFLTIFMVLVVLLPSLALSYFAARQTTRRLQQLTDATTQLRQGDYHTQVTVQGEDEVAALQTNFNMMAHDLERAIHDVQNERDTVTKLLQNRRELVASVSHELRTPIATLRGYLESMNNRWHDQLPEALVHDITVMEAETLRLQRLIDDLFALSRAEVGELTINCQPTVITPVIQNIAAAVAPSMWHTSKVELIVDLPDHLPLAMVDGMRLEQILHNLLRNGARHTPPGGIVAITADTTAERIIVKVKDTGEGIAAEHLPHIWERFYRIDSAQGRDPGGAGLGLALVKELMEAMGGTVNVSSKPGIGSTFSILLPRT